MLQKLTRVLFFFCFTIEILFAEPRQPDLTIQVPMRDGTLLPTDLYFPKSQLEKRAAPCILMRSPAGRRAISALGYIDFTNYGYVIVIQETRHAIDTTGKSIPYFTDGWGDKQDGFDTVNWLAESEYTNGKIGTVGYSALGITQLLLAPTNPTALKCQYIGMAASSLYHDAIFPGGRFSKHQVEGWLGKNGKSPDVLNYIRSLKTYSDFWATFDTKQVAEKVHVPAIHMGGWYDIFVQGTIDAFVARQENGGVGARGKQKLVIGPWIHWWPLNMKLGDFQVPEHAMQPPIDLSAERWFAYHLKGQENGIMSEPAVTYYVMGPFDGSPSKGNVWRHTHSWPIPAKETVYYLTPKRSLTTQLTDPLTISFSYTDDLNDPIPTLGGRNLFLESGPKDQRPVEERSDIVVFTSEPLIQDLEVTGRIKAKIFFSSNKPESALVVRLCDVYPDGRSILITDGITHVNTTEKEKAEEIEVDLWSTSMVFAKGHRLRVSVSASNYPRFDKTKPQDEEQLSSHHTIYVSKNYPSRIILPIVHN